MTKHYSRRTNLRFNQDDNGMLKSKHPSMFSEYLFRAVRSEGPVNSFSIRLEAVLDFCLLQFLMSTCGTKENKKKPMHL